MELKVFVELFFENPEEILEAVEVDNTQEIQSTANSGKILTFVRGESVGRVKNTVDDFLACVVGAEKVRGGF